MIRAFRYPLKPNATEERALLRYLSACQQIYNAALEEKRDAYRKQGVTVSRYEQQKELTELRGQDADYAAIPVEVLRSALLRLDRAYTGFFRRVKAGQKAGFPRFRSRDRYDSFSFCNPVIDGDRIKIPKLGYVKMNLYRPLRGTPKEAQVRRTAKGWYVSIICDLGAAPPVDVNLDKIVGIDLGLTSCAVLSTGEEIANPRFFRESEERLARRQRALQAK
ncbi:MAG: RNA-guided endonuclease InsQ/TnpB family protein, partial [Polyangiales bacterium]